MKKIPNAYVVTLILLAPISLLFFPPSLTLILTLPAALVYPQIALFTGIFADILYYAPKANLEASYVGALVYFFAVFVRYIFKTRIM